MFSAAHYYSVKPSLLKGITSDFEGIGSINLVTPPNLQILVPPNGTVTIPIPNTYNKINNEKESYNAGELNSNLNLLHYNNKSNQTWFPLFWNQSVGTKKSLDMKYFTGGSGAYGNSTILTDWVNPELEGYPETTGKDILGRKRLNNSTCEGNINCQNNNINIGINTNKGGYSYCIPSNNSNKYVPSMEAIEMPKNKGTIAAVAPTPFSFSNTVVFPEYTADSVQGKIVQKILMVLILKKM